MKPDGYVDIHSHIIPEVDDGAPSMEVAEQMLIRAYDQGIRIMYATPHCNSEKLTCEKKFLLEQYDKVREIASSIGDEGIELILGNEILYGHDIISKIELGEYFTMGDTRFILVEFHYNVRYNDLYDALKRIADAGYKPILAHVERYACLYKGYRELDDLISLGVSLQLSTECVLRKFDRKVAFFIKMLKRGYIHFLGSDCHSITWRAPVMQDAVAVLRKKVPDFVLDIILYTNPNILRNDGFL